MGKPKIVLIEVDHPVDERQVGIHDRHSIDSNVDCENNPLIPPNDRVIQIEPEQAVPIPMAVEIAPRRWNLDPVLPCLLAVLAGMCTASSSFFVYHGNLGQILGLQMPVYRHAFNALYAVVHSAILYPTTRARLSAGNFPVWYNFVGLGMLGPGALFWRAYLTTCTPRETRFLLQSLMPLGLYSYTQGPRWIPGVTTIANVLIFVLCIGPDSDLLNIVQFTITTVMRDAVVLLIRSLLAGIPPTLVILSNNLVGFLLDGSITMVMWLSGHHSNLAYPRTLEAWIYLATMAAMIYLGDYLTRYATVRGVANDRSPHPDAIWFMRTFSEISSGTAIFYLMTDVAPSTGFVIAISVQFLAPLYYILESWFSPPVAECWAMQWEMLQAAGISIRNLFPRTRRRRRHQHQA